MRGFTLVELVISVSLLALFAVISVVYFVNLQKDTDLEVVARKVVSGLRETQVRSMAGERTSEWGVFFSTTTPTENFFSLFHGPTYASATATTTAYIPFNLRFSNITLNGGGFEVRFTRVTGATTQYGTGASNQALCITTGEEPSACKKSIRVTPAGKIDWQ